MVPFLFLILLSLGAALGQVQQPSTAGGGAGGDGAINDGVSSSIKATVFDYVNSNPLGVVLRDTNGDYVSVGGGTQYTEGAVQATPVGTVALGRDASNILRSLLVDASRNLLVGVNLALPAGSNTIGGVNLSQYTPISGRLPVDGSGVTQPISAASLPLPTGASTLVEQQTQTTALQLIDDVVHANDVALGKVSAIGAQFDDVTPGATTEDNVRAVRMSTRRELYTQIRDAAGNERGANVTAGNALVVDGSAVTQPISAASLPLPTGAATETTLGTRLADATFTARINTQGQKTMVGSTPVVIASDQSAVPVSGTVTANAGTGTFNIQANASVNLAQIAGAATLTGNGVTGTGSPRVTIASDNTAFGVNLAQYTPSAGRLPVELNSNAGVNVAQMNGVAVTMGNGVSGTGVQRVAAASDNSAIANWGHGATGAAPPAGATQIGGVTSGATGGFLAAPTVCTEYANITQTANTQVITGVAGRRIYICSINLVTATAQNVAIVAGTVTTCGTGTAAVPGTSGGTTAATGWNFAANGGIVLGAGFGAIAKTTVDGNNLCVLQSGSGQLSGGIAYAIY